MNSLKSDFLRECARGRNRTGTSRKTQDFKSCVSTNSTTRATWNQKSNSLELLVVFCEARDGFEPTNKAFAELSLTTWRPRQKVSNFIELSADTVNGSFRYLFWVPF